MAKRSLGKWSLIPQEKGFLVGLASVFISPWFFAWYALDELAKCLEDISEDLQALADQESLTEDTWTPREPEGPEGDDGVYVDIASVFNIDHRRN